MSDPKPSSRALVAVIMGSKSDWEIMTHCVSTLESLGIPNEPRVLSAHRTPDALFEHVAAMEKKGVKVFIAAAGGAAHLAGVIAAKTALPVLGVPMESKALHGMDSLLSMVQMPSGIPVATFAVGKAGAVNAALFAAAILAEGSPEIRTALHQFRRVQTENILKHPDPRQS